MTMNRKFARWAAGLSAAVALPAAVIVSTAASASADPVQQSTARSTAATSASAAPLLWEYFDNYTLPVEDSLECELKILSLVKQYPDIPASSWTCTQPEYDGVISHWVVYLYFTLPPLP